MMAAIMLLEKINLSGGVLSIFSAGDAFFPERKIRIFTPPGYETNNLSYKVLYMHDGQNLFQKTTSFAGEWEVDETIERLVKQYHHHGLIVVGIDNTKERMSEYTYDYAYLGAPHSGKAYMDYLKNIVKPFVDLNFKTLPSRKDTLLCGSSMGGLITFFGGLSHLKTFGSLLCFSTSSQRVSDEATSIPLILKSVDQALLRETKFYFYVGDTKDGNVMWPKNYQTYLVNAGVDSKNVCLNIGKGYTHNEAAWAQHFPASLIWLFDLKEN